MSKKTENSQEKFNSLDAENSVQKNEQSLTVSGFEDFEPIMDYDSFNFAQLENENDKLIGTYLGTYSQVCERMNSKPKPKVKGHVFFTEKGLEVVNHYHALDKSLNDSLINKMLLIVRGKTVYKEGTNEAKYINFLIATKKQ